MNKDLTPPAWIDNMLDRLAPHDFAEEIKGDLYELFVDDVKHYGLRTANRKYVRNAFGFLWKSFFWKRTQTTNAPGIMLKSHFKMASRSLRTNRTTTVINILGLVVGLASAMVIFSIIHYEMSFDTFHSDADRIYRIVRVSGDDKSEFRTGVSLPVPGTLKEEISSLKKITALQYFGGAIVDVLDQTGTSVRQFKEDRGCVMIEPSFFEIFDFHDKPVRWLQGDPRTALKEPLSVVLTTSMAKKYFGDENALGKTIQFEKYHEAKVTGVVEDFPANTDFPFTIMVSYSTMQLLAKDRMQDWSSVNDDNQAYVVLHPGQTKSSLEKEIADVHKKYVHKDMAASRHYLLQELAELHFDKRFGNFNGRTISHETILTLTFVAIFLLAAAAINYINLSTAQSVLRSKEIGLRKVLGSSKQSLVFQFLTETMVIVVLSGVVAIGIAELMLRYMEPLLNIRWDMTFFLSLPIALTWLGTTILITLLAGLYPSIIASQFNPVTALTNRFSSGKVGGFSLRKTLVVLQFTMTQVFVVGTFIMVSQMRYIQQADLGFNREAIVTINLPPDPGAEIQNSTLQVLANEFRDSPVVEDLSYSYTLPSGVRRNRSYQDIGREDAHEMKDFRVHEYGSIDSTYLRLYGIKLLAGRNLNMHDTAGNIIINKTLVKNLSLGTPENAVGVVLKRGGGAKATVVGVIDDYYSNSLKEGADNIMLEMNAFNYNTVSLKLNLADKDKSLTDVVATLEQVWHKHFPQHVFTYEFFDDNVQSFYEQEQKFATLFQMFTVVIMLIGCLGLYGLITFVVNRKGKEVAIRKVLGAKLSNILVLFSREYVQLIGLSFFIAVPVAYWFIDNWLNEFKNHITLQWWLFAVPGVLVLLMALTVVGAKSFAAANANPVQKLKEE